MADVLADGTRDTMREPRRRPAGPLGPAAVDDDAADGKATQEGEVVEAVGAGGGVPGVGLLVGRAVGAGLTRVR